jgi:hypothetical protein
MTERPKVLDLAGDVSYRFWVNTTTGRSQARRADLDNNRGTGCN